jgi:hypothetical protein
VEALDMIGAVVAVVEAAVVVVIAVAMKKLATN